MRGTLFLIAFVVAAVALATPAQAALTAVLTATTPSYSGACPTTMAFAGSISGPPGTAFQYSFSRYVNGVQQVQNVGAVTLPTSGTVPVSDSISIAATSTGINFDQIWVHNIAGGQPDVYSNRGPFSVTCGSGKPGVVYETSTTETGHSAAAYALRLPAPTNVHATTDPKECATHLPPTPLGVLLAPVCAEILTGGGAEIVFSWEGTSIYPDVDGFHVFNVAGHISNPGMASTAGGSNTVVFKKGPVGPACYVIRAYKGAAESEDSPMACVAGGSSSRTVSLNATNVRSYKDSIVKGTSSDGRTGTSTSSIVVGHDYSFARIIIGDHVFNSFTRAGVLFDVQSLHANFIFKAVLHVHTVDQSRSCISEVGLGTNLWWQNADRIDGDFSSAASPSGVWDLKVDVTNEVRDMFKGKPNLGFIMRGDDENFDAFTISMCRSVYAMPAQLEVTFN